MAGPKSDKPLVSSILDRLIDEDPDTKREPPQSQGQVLAELRQAVRRDLENLLNTRWRCTSWPEELTELDRSLVSYGVPDVSSSDLKTEAGRRAYLRRIEETIREFEPRFKSIRVLPLENVDYLDRTLRFRVDATLHAHPAPEPVVFDSSLEPATGKFAVRGGKR